MKPEVGLLATICFVDDMYPAVVTAVSRSGHRVTVKYSDPPQEEVVYTRRKNGKYGILGGRSSHLRLGVAEYYRNPDI